MSQPDAPLPTPLGFVQQIEQQVQPLAAQSEAIKVRTADQFRTAAELVLGWKALKKFIEQELKDPKTKAKAAHEAICDLEKRQLTPVVSAIEAVTAKMSAWELTEEKRRQNEEARKTAAAPADAPPPAVASRVPDVDKLSSRSTWSFEVTDAAKLPREYLCPDDTLIGKLVRAIGKAAETTCPGIRVTEHKSYVGRS